MQTQITLYMAICNIYLVKVDANPTVTANSHQHNGSRAYPRQSCHQHWQKGIFFWSYTFGLFNSGSNFSELFTGIISETPHQTLTDLELLPRFLIVFCILIGHAIHGSVAMVTSTKCYHTLATLPK